jgi:hypothetical protein
VHKPKILFILKFRETYDGGYGAGMSSGLLNSATFVLNMLKDSGFHAKLVQVKDNNDIDREVTLFKPTHVFIEALWVVPEKFTILHKLHPGVKWIVRGHSEIPFLSQEGVAMEWICAYVKHKNVIIAPNSPHSTRDIRQIIRAAHPHMSQEEVAEKVVCLPNYYPHKKMYKRKHKEKEHLDIACFGAIRPLKNQLMQAVVAIEYANIMRKPLRFHINASRCEQRGENVLKNLRALFDNTHHELVEHSWMEHHKFLKVLATMDISMCVSFTETFNIVAADSVSSGVPLICSSEITWANSWCQAEPTDSEDILVKMLRIGDWRLQLASKVLNYRGLKRYCENSKKSWLAYLGKH